MGARPIQLPGFEFDGERIISAKEAVDVCREMGSDHVILWPAHDGYEYPFQMDYRSAWHRLYDAYIDQGGTVPDAKNKLQTFDGTALERLLTVAKTM